MPSKLYLFPHAALVSFGYLTVLADGSLWSTLSTSGTLLSPQLFTGARSNFKAKCHKQDCFLGTRDPYLYHLKKLLPLSGHLTVGIETLPGMNINFSVLPFPSSITFLPTMTLIYQSYLPMKEQILKEHTSQADQRHLMKFFTLKCQIQGRHSPVSLRKCLYVFLYSQGVVGHVRGFTLNTMWIRIYTLRNYQKA